MFQMFTLFSFSNHDIVCGQVLKFNIRINQELNKLHFSPGKCQLERNHGAHRIGVDRISFRCKTCVFRVFMCVCKRDALHSSSSSSSSSLSSSSSSSSSNM